MDTALRAESASVDARPDVRASSVDSALGAWRNETVARRAVWDLRAAQHDAEQTRRWRRTAALVGAGAGVAVLSAVVTALLATLLLPAATSPVPVPVASAIGVIDVGPAVAPQRTVSAASEPVAAAIPAPATVAGAVTARELGLLGEARSWQANGGLWVQVDYTGAPLVLRWTDASGAAVLEPTPCVNVIGDDLRRCYIGRSARRIATARAEGAAPGLWTASACRDDRCLPIATWDVR